MEAVTISTLTIQLPDSIQAEAEMLSERDGITPAQFLALAAAEKVSALKTVDFLRRADVFEGETAALGAGLQRRRLPSSQSVPPIRLRRHTARRRISHGLFHRPLHRHGFRVAEGPAKIFEAMDQIGDLLSRIGAARRLAEMGPATEGPISINKATPSRALQHGTNPFLAAIHHSPSTGLFPGLRGNQRLCLGQIWRLARELKSATGRLRRAVTFEVPLLQLRVNPLHFFFDVSGCGFGHKGSPEDRPDASNRQQVFYFPSSSRHRW